MCWNPNYIILIIISTLIDYFAGIMMSKMPTKKSRVPFLILSLLMNLGLLFSFKYFNFFNSTFQGIFNYFNIAYHVKYLKVLLPVGISFYTFQTLSYTIDVFRGQKEAEKHLGIFALYVSFFPQLVAGPIERSQSLMPQLRKVNHFSAENLKEGLKLIFWGYFKKVVIADRLALIVNPVYNNIGHYKGLSLIIPTYLFAFQIFCDFSGYSDIAIGSARIMGYDLMVNFKRPYFAKSISEFWKRWHVSLSTWFKDYLYISLGGNRVVKWRWYFNLFIVFLISGFWHGANWTFMIWGALHGLYLIFSIVTEKIRLRLRTLFGLENYPTAKKLWQVLITFHLVLIAWVFFRANNLSSAIYVFKNSFVDFLNFKFISPITLHDFYVAIFSMIFMEVVHVLQRGASDGYLLPHKTRGVRYTVYAVILVMVVFFGRFDVVDFIYFQF